MGFAALIISPMFKSLFGLLLFFVVCTACSQPPTDKQSPELNLAGTMTRTVTGSRVTLEGELDPEVTSFVYRLNDAEAKDVFSSVTEGHFKVTIEGLAPGANTIVLEAKDASGNKTVSEPVTVTVIAVAGLWGSHQVPYQICDGALPTVLVVELTPSPEGFTGSVSTGFGGDYKVSAFSGQFGDTGVLETPVRFPGEFLGDPEITGTMRLQFVGSNLGVRLVYNDGQRCNPSDDVTVDVVVEGELQKGVDLPPLPPDDTLEPNNDKTKATPAVLPYFGTDLVLVRKNSDWFRLEVTAASVITVTFDTAQPVAGAILTLYDNSRKIGDSFFPVHRRKPLKPDSWGWTVAQGVYWLEVQGTPFFLEAAMPYDLTIEAVNTVDAEFEPGNNAPATAPTISLPFCKTLTLPAKDEDWFRFSLAQPTELSFTAFLFGGTYLYDSKLNLLNPDNQGNFSYDVPLPKGEYFVQIKGSEDAVASQGGDGEYQLGLMMPCSPEPEAPSLDTPTILSQN